MIHMCRVVGVHHESHSIDVVFMDDNRRMSGVPLMSASAGGDCGNVDLPVPTANNAADPFSSTTSGQRDIYALVMFTDKKMPVAMGFVYPTVAQCLFMAQNFRVNRHASDVYHTIDAEGNIELYHPSGTYIRIGTDTDHVDLTGTDYNGKWKTQNNTTTTPGMKVQIANGGSVKATISIDSSGNISMSGAGTLSLSATGAATISSSGLTINSSVTVNGAVTTTGDVTANGKSLDHHTHSGVQNGSSNTGQPN